MVLEAQGIQKTTDAVKANCLIHEVLEKKNWLLTKRYVTKQLRGLLTNVLITKQLLKLE